MFRQNGMMANHSTYRDTPPSPGPAQSYQRVPLRKRRCFLFVQQKGVRQVMAHFILQAVKPKDEGPDYDNRAVQRIRTGVTASKKVGNAVARNRAKRRMRALFRLFSQTDFPGSDWQADYVLVARHSLVTARWDELKADFHKAAETVNKKLSHSGIQERRP